MGAVRSCSEETQANDAWGGETRTVVNIVCEVDDTSNETRTIDRRIKKLVRRGMCELPRKPAHVRAWHRRLGRALYASQRWRRAVIVAWERGRGWRAAMAQWKAAYAKYEKLDKLNKLRKNPPNAGSNSHE